MKTCWYLTDLFYLNLVDQNHLKIAGLRTGLLGKPVITAVFTYFNAKTVTDR